MVDKIESRRSRRRALANNLKAHIDQVGAYHTELGSVVAISHSYNDVKSTSAAVRRVAAGLTLAGVTTAGLMGVGLLADVQTLLPEGGDLTQIAIEQNQGVQVYCAHIASQIDDGQLDFAARSNETAPSPDDRVSQSAKNRLSRALAEIELVAIFHPMADPNMLEGLMPEEEAARLVQEWKHSLVPDLEDLASSAAGRSLAIDSRRITSKIQELEEAIVRDGDEPSLKNAGMQTFLGLESDVKRLIDQIEAASR